MRRLVFTLFLLSSFLLPSTALARGGTYAAESATPREQATIRAALDASSFDWSLIGAPVTVHVRRGIVSHSTPGHVWLDRGLLASGRFSWATVQDEFAHQLDFFRFDQATRDRLNVALDGRAWCYDVPGLSHSEYGCERFASTLVWAYWPSKDNAYRPTSSRDESAAMAPARFRALLADVLGERSLLSVRR